MWEKAKKLFFNFEGRIDRIQFLIGHLILFAYTIFVPVLLSMVMVNLFGGTGNIVTSLLIIAATIVSIVANFALIVKRLHDINLSGWWSLVVLIPYIGIIAVILIYFIPGTPTQNRFGPVPGNVENHKD